MIDRQTLLSIRRIFLCCGFGLIVPELLFSQDRDPEAVREENLQELFDRKIAVTHWAPAASSIAMQLMENYDLVADGEFIDFPADAPNGLSVLEPREVVVQFRPTNVYRGDSVPGPAIDVRLNSDMLSAPGEEPAISRYAKRQQVRQSQAQQLDELDKQIVRLSDDLLHGRVTAQAFKDRETRLLAQREQLLSESLAASTRIVAVIDAKTFYDLGGAIRTDVPYLVGLNRTADDIRVYALEEMPRSGANILWGDARDAAVAVLDGQVR